METLDNIYVTQSTLPTEIRNIVITPTARRKEDGWILHKYRRNPDTQARRDEANGDERKN